LAIDRLSNTIDLGASLARLEASIALSHVIERLPNPRLAVPEVEHHGSFLTRGPTQLPIDFDVRAAL
jgi:cytochrome P450